jgi:hypothetical protein
VRSKLEAVENELELNTEQREELWGLKGSSFKREAEAAWRFSRTVTGAAAERWSIHSRAALDDALEAYGIAAGYSRDNHWSWVQFLVLEAVRRGSLADHADDWTCARAAALDDISRTPVTGLPDQQRAKTAKNAAWAWGSLVELLLLGPMVGRNRALDEAKEFLDHIGECCELLLGVEDRDDALFPVVSTLTQLERYMTWWSQDGALELPSAIVADARELFDHLHRLHERLKQQ